MRGQALDGGRTQRRARRHDAPTSDVALRGSEVARVCAVGIGQALALVAILFLVAHIVDAAATSARTDTAARDLPLRSVALLVLVVVLFGVLRAVEFSVTERAGYRAVQELRMRMYSHLQGMVPRELQHRSRGALLLRFTGDLSMLRTWISRGLLGGLVSCIVLVGAVAALAVLNLAMTAAVVIVVAVGALLSLASGERVRRATRTMRRRRSLLISNVDEQLHALAVVQAFGRADGEYCRLSRQNDSLTRALFQVARLRGYLRGVSSATGLLAAVAVLAVGIVELAAGRATMGIVVATLTIARQLHGPVRTLGLAHDYWQRQRVSREKIDDFLRSSSTPFKGAGLERMRVRRGRIQLEGLSVEGSLRLVTAEVVPGQLVGITGPQGAGKSTLLAAVARLAGPTAGAVRIDGHSVADSTSSSVAAAVGVAGPDLPLMRGTVRRNLTYRDPEASDDEVRRIVDVTGLDATLADLPDGITTWLHEGGRNISAGQRQHIALARALLGNPPVLLLDEPTSQLDNDARSAIHDVLVRHSGTVLMVSHDPRELALADRVWTMHGGQITEDVSGEEYRDRLWRTAQRSSRSSAETS